MAKKFIKIYTDDYENREDKQYGVYYEKKESCWMVNMDYALNHFATELESTANPNNILYFCKRLISMLEFCPEEKSEILMMLLKDAIKDYEPVNNPSKPRILLKSIKTIKIIGEIFGGLK